MLETIAQQCSARLDVSFQALRYDLHHVVTEDVGLTLGGAVRGLAFAKLATGIDGAGSGDHGMDEAWAHSLISLEGRSFASVERDAPGSQVEHVEDMLAADLREFFSGFAQGSRCAVHVWLRRGEDPHHSWEAAYRAFGLALRRTLAANPARADSSGGIKGLID